MTREGFDGSAQERGLRELERRTGKRAKHLAAALDCDTQTWRRYFWGQQPLRSDMIPAVSNAWIAVMSGRQVEEAAPLALQAGADVFFTKPLRLRQVRAWVDAVARAAQ